MSPLSHMYTSTAPQHPNQKGTATNSVSFKHQLSHCSHKNHKKERVFTTA